MKRWIKVFGIMVLMLSIIGCQREQADSLFDWDEDFRPDPEITSISPDSALGGITEITIQGNNFSANIEENLIYFRDDKNAVNEGNILSATETELQVIPPAMYGDSIDIKLAVRGALVYADYTPYKLMPALKEINLRIDADNPEADQIARGIAVDRMENVFINMDGGEIKKMSTDGTVTNFLSTALNTYGLAIGAGDTIFAPLAGRNPVIRSVSPDGTIEIFTSISGAATDLDFDQDGNLWLTSTDEVLLVKPDGSELSIDTFPLALHRIRVIDNSVYILGRSDDYSEQIVWHCEIDGESLVNRTEYLNVANESWVDTINAFEFDENGSMYVATNQSQDGLYVLDQSGEASIVYEGLLDIPLTELTWGNDTYLYGSMVDYSPVANGNPAESKLAKIDLQKYGSIHWGRTF